MTEKLKPCPFCGGKAQHYTYSTYGGREKHGIECLKCIKACVDHCETKKEAVEAWNRRIGDD